MKLAVLSDLHGHNYKEFDKHSDLTGSTRLDHIIKTLEFIRDDCVQRDIKYVLFGGDMFHIRARVNTIVYNAIYDVIKTFYEHGITIIGIAGNHDQHDNSDVPQHSLHTFNDLPGVTIYGDLDTYFIPEWETDDKDLLIHCVPYSKNAKRTKDWIEGQAEKYDANGDTNHICLFHLGISGAFVGKGSYPMADAFRPEDLRPDFFKYIVGGHFHKAQFIENYPHFFYTGAPIEHSFSDEGEEKGYYIIDTAKRWDVSFVPIPSPRFISVSATDVMNDYLRDYVSLTDYVRIHVAEKDLQEVLKHIPVGLQYKIILEKTYEEQTRVDVRIGMSEEEVVTKYAEEHNPEALEIGLKILAEVKANGNR
jgi:DNA repair exonuclease SbcCD nuclease subunit